MPRYHLDEVAKLEDIEALLITARDLAERFKNDELTEASCTIRCALGDIRSAKARLVAEWRAIDNPDSVN